MHIGERIDCLQFHHQTIVNEQVQTIGVLNDEAFVGDGTDLLRREPNPTERQFMLQCPLVGGLKESGAKFPMHLDSRANDSFGQLIDICVHLCDLRFPQCPL